MRNLKILLIGLWLFSGLDLHSQDCFSYGSSNYGGVTQLLANPAAAAGNKLKLDILLVGADLTFNNSWAAVKRDAISFPELPGSWKNFTPNLPDNIYKNFEWQNWPISKEAILEQRYLLPSVLVSINKKSSIAFSSSLRQIGNLSGLSSDLANLFEKEFDLSVLQNNPVENRNFMAIRMSWIEYGITYSRVLLETHTHTFKAGITPKILQGLESSYFLLRDLSFLFSNKDTLSYFNADFSVAHSARSGSALDLMSNLPDKLKHGSPMTFGLDVGIVYEWSPQHGSLKDDPQEKSYGIRHPPYKIKAGISVVDIGKIRFNKEKNYYDMQLSLRQTDIIRYISAENIQMIDSLLQTDFPANTGEATFSVLLPTAMNIQVDYSLNKMFFINVSSHLCEFNRAEIYKVRNYSTVCLAPRFESYWVDASLCVTWNTLSAKRSQTFTPGINLRFGPLTIGTSDLTFLYKKNLASLNFYTMLRISIPYKNSPHT